MNAGAPAVPVEGSSEIFALIETLLATEERLVELTGGEVDTVATTDGRTILLRRAQDQLRVRVAKQKVETDLLLQQRHAELRVLFDLIPALIWFKDTQNRIVRVNQRVADSVGRSVEEIEGKSSLEIYPQEAAKYYADDLQVIGAGIAKLGIVEVLRDAEGRECWVQTDKMPVRDPEGKVVGIVVMSQDITERRSADQTLRLLSSAVQQSKEAILITDAELDFPGPRIIFANPAFETMTGYTEAEVLGKTPRILQGPLTDREVINRLRKNLREGEVFRGETVNYRKDGEAFVLEWHIAPMRNAAGETTHFVAVERDITGRKAAHDALRLSEKRFKAVFEQAAVGVAQTEAGSGRYVHINQRFCDILGRSPEEMRQVSFSEITHPEDVSRDLELMRDLLVGKLREGTHEKRYLRKDGKEIWASVTVSAMWAPGEKPDFLLIFAHDVTERKSLEDQFRQSQKMEAIGTLAGGIAHDFNNILAAITGYTELSQLTLGESPQIRANLTAILQATGRATALVDQILTFSRRQPLQRRPVQLLPVVAEALALLRATIPTTIEFETDLSVNSPTVLADTGQIHQILMNLGTNSWHAMKDRPGKLTVSLERFEVDAALAATQTRLRPGLFARVSVSDTGAGMDGATLGRIFEPFFTTKPLGEGTGLGLAVVHGIMDTHDGAITVSSHPGEGTVFRLYFPAHAGETKTVASADGPLIHGHGESVLFVDDEESLARAGQRSLSALGYDAESVTQPAAALAMVRENPTRFSLVITDQTMPAMTGLALARELRLVCPDLAIILTTGYSRGLSSADIEKAGIRRLLQKPYTLQSLGVEVHAALSPKS